MRWLALVFGFILVSLLAAPLWAGQLVGEDPQEALVRQIAVQLRCPVCQSENILDSHSGTAREMLDLVREQVAAGQGESEIKTFFRSRYGDYVLLSPPTTGPGAVIWLIPGLLALGGAALAILLIRGMRRESLEPPREGELLTEARLEELEP